MSCVLIFTVEYTDLNIQKSDKTVRFFLKLCDILVKVSTFVVV